MLPFNANLVYNNYRGRVVMQLVKKSRPSVWSADYRPSNVRTFPPAQPPPQPGSEKNKNDKGGKRQYAGVAVRERKKKQRTFVSFGVEVRKRRTNRTCVRVVTATRCHQCCQCKHDKGRANLHTPH